MDRLGPRDDSYKDKLGEVLRTRDPAGLHLFLRQQAASFGDAEQVSDLERRSHGEMTELLHRMTLARPDLADLHAESRAWLAGRGTAGGSAPSPRRRSTRGRRN